MQATNISLKATVTSVYTQADLDALRSETVMVTPEMAKILRADCAFERQRPIANSNISRLVFEMSKTWFIRGTPIYLCVLPDGTMKLANGNHTLEAIMASGMAVPLTLIYNKVQSLDEVAAIYANLDLQKTRSWRTALQAMSGHATNFEGKVLSAVGMIQASFNRPGGANPGHTASRNARFDLLTEYRDAGQLVQQAMSGAPRINTQMMERTGILAAALLTARYQPSTALEFWSGVAHDDGLAVGDPKKALLRFMQAHKSGTASDRTDQVRAAALAWNAFFNQRELVLCKPGAMGALKVLGTSWHHGRPQASATATWTASLMDRQPKQSKSSIESGIVHLGDGSSHKVARFAG